MNNTFLESSTRYALCVPALLAAYKLYINELLLLCVTQKNKNSLKSMIGDERCLRKLINNIRLCLVSGLD